MAIERKVRSKTPKMLMVMALLTPIWVISAFNFRELYPDNQWALYVYFSPVLLLVIVGWLQLREFNLLDELERKIRSNAMAITLWVVSALAIVQHQCEMIGIATLPAGTYLFLMMGVYLISTWFIRRKYS